MIQNKVHAKTSKNKPDIPDGVAEDKEVTHAPWQREFFKNIDSFISYGVPEEKAKELLTTFLKLSGSTPMPEVMDSFRSEERLEEVGVYSKRAPEIRDFMVQFLDPLMSDFTIEGKENLQAILPLLGKFPIALISNNLSHLDAPGIYNILYWYSLPVDSLLSRTLPVWVCT